MVDTRALMDIRTSQAIKTSSHPAVHIHVSPILTCCFVENPSEVVPSFPLNASNAALFGIRKKNDQVETRGQNTRFLSSCGYLMRSCTTEHSQPTARKDEMALERVSAHVAFKFLSAACTTALPSTVS